jgi:hypothetical protein
VPGAGVDKLRPAVRIRPVKVFIRPGELFWKFVYRIYYKVHQRLLIFLNQYNNIFFGINRRWCFQMIFESVNIYFTDFVQHLPWNWAHHWIVLYSRRYPEKIGIYIYILYIYIRVYNSVAVCICGITTVVDTFVLITYRKHGFIAPLRIHISIWMLYCHPLNTSRQTKLLRSGPADERKGRSG